jgi:hypothetical protein
VAEIDEFSDKLLEESKRLLEKASDEDADSDATAAYLHASLLLAFCSLEAHVNAIADDFARRPEGSVHEKAFLLERKVRMEHGVFVMKGALCMTKLEDRMRFLHVKFGKPVDSAAPHWGRLTEAANLRNQLTHPRETVVMTKQDVGKAISAIVDTLDALYRAIYGGPFPSANLGLNSTLEF